MSATCRLNHHKNKTAIETNGKKPLSCSTEQYAKSKFMSRDSAMVKMGIKIGVEPTGAVFLEQFFLDSSVSLLFF